MFVRTTSAERRRKLYDSHGGDPELYMQWLRDAAAQHSWSEGNRALPDRYLLEDSPQAKARKHPSSYKHKKIPVWAILALIVVVAVIAIVFLAK